MNINNYNYIDGRIYCSNVGSKYTPYGQNYQSVYAWKVELESVKLSGAGILAEHLDGDSDGWRVGINSSKHPYVYWSRNSSYRYTYTFTDLTVNWNEWTYIKFEQPSYRSIKCTVGESSQTVSVGTAWNNNYNRDLAVGDTATTSFRGKMTVQGYAYNSNTLNTAQLDLDTLSVGATSATINGNTFSVSEVKNYTTTYAVDYNANGGSGTVPSDTKYYGTALTLPNGGFTKTGYHMTSWRLNSASGMGYALGGSYTTNANATFYAAWTLNTYEVKFNANGGSGTMNDQQFTYGTAQNLTTNAFTRNGYRFVGWATSADGSVVYTDGEEVNNLTTVDAATVNLYAVWVKSGIHVKDGTWKDGQVFVHADGEWKTGIVYAKNNGVWEQGS